MNKLQSLFNSLSKCQAIQGHKPEVKSDAELRAEQTIAELRATLRGSRNVRLHQELEEWKARAEKAEAIISSALKVLPVGNLKTHTPDSIPERIWDLLGQLYEATKETEAAEKERDELRTQYNELIYEVIQKHEGESRHDTARRYIREREQRIDGTCCDALPNNQGGAR